MKIKFGPSDGNSGAIVRWGNHLGKGIWLRTWKFRKLWFKGFKLMRNDYGTYINAGLFVVRL